MKINNQKSQNKDVINGVPQGSILGPLLFIIYINDLVNSSEILHKIIFADDTNLLFSHSNAFELQEILNTELQKMDIWFKCNRLSLNISKTNYIVFNSNKKASVADYIRLKINDKELLRVSSTKFLGILIKESLNFKHHIEHLISNLAKYVGLFFKLRHYLPLTTLLTLYKTLFEPHINYWNVIWCNTYPSYLKKLESLQKKIIRAMSWSEYNAPTKPLFYRFGLLRLTELNSFHNACVMHQVIHKTNPRLCELVPVCGPRHMYETRKKHLITGKKRRLKTTSLSLVCRGPQTWNQLDESLKAEKSISAFKKKLKTKLLDSYIELQP